MRRSPKPGALTARDLEAAAQLVDDERGIGLALDILGDDQERTARLHNRLEDRQQRLEVAELLLVDEDVRIGKLDLHLLGIGDVISREIAAIELHALDNLELEFETLGFLDGDHAFLADLLHRFGDLLADFGVAIGRDDADLGDFLRAGDRLGTALEVLDDLDHGEIDAALEVHRIHAGGDRLHALAHDRLSEHGRGSGAVTGNVVGLRGHFAHHLGAHVLELVLELDLLGDGDAVLGDARGAEALVDDDVAALGAERDLHCVGEDVDAAQDTLARVAAEFNVLGCHDFLFLR